MLPSLGFQEIVLLGVLALLVVGPKELPLLLRKLGRWTAKLRGMAQEFRSGFDELARQAELDELKKEVDSLRRTANFSEIRNEMTKPLGTLESYAGISPPPPPSEPLPTPDVDAPAQIEAQNEPKIEPTSVSPVIGPEPEEPPRPAPAAVAQP